MRQRNIEIVAYIVVVVLVVLAVVLIGRGVYASRSAAPHSAERLANSEPAPVVLWIGGGGWVGHQESHAIRDALNMHGVIVSTVRYAGSDTMYHDVQDAHDEAAAFAIANGREFFVIGHSAGGHMAAWLASTSDDAELYINLGGPLAPYVWLREYERLNLTDESPSIRQVQQDRKWGMVDSLTGRLLSVYQLDDPVTGWHYDSIKDAAVALEAAHPDRVTIHFDNDPLSTSHWFNGEHFVRRILRTVL